MYPRQLMFLWPFNELTPEKKTIKNYRLFLVKFEKKFGNQSIRKISSEGILSFLVQNTEGQKQSTKRLK
jgi:integrase/recombinase XerD